MELLAKMVIMGPIELALAGGVILVIAVIVWIATRRK